MKRTQLEHLIRVSGAIVEETEFVVIGSQSILGAIPDPPRSLTMSMEADIYPLVDASRADEVDGAIGEGSAFHDRFGYYAQGVGPETATLPSSWRSRVHEIQNANTNGIRGLCLDPHDLAMSKYAAGREKDAEFNRELIVHGFVEQAMLEQLVDEMPADASLKELIRTRIKRDFSRDVASRKL